VAGGYAYFPGIIDHRLKAESGSGRTASFAATFVMLTWIGGRKYIFLVKRDTDSDLNGKDHRVARKSKFL
jgi:hypothetical protein